MIIYGLNSCDVELAGNLLGLWQWEWLVIWSAYVAADERRVEGSLGWVPDNALLRDGGKPCYSETDSCCMSGVENLYKYVLPVWGRGLSFPGRLGNFVRVNITLLTAVCQLSAAPDTTKSQSRVCGCVIQKCPVVLSRKKRKHQMLLFKQRPSFMLNTTKITWFSVLRI